MTPYFFPLAAAMIVGKVTFVAEVNNHQDQMMNSNSMMSWEIKI